MGLVFGFVTAIVAEFDLTQTWLLIAYGLVVYILLTAFLYHAPQARRLQVAADASPEDRASDELQRLVTAPVGTLVNVVDGLAWLGIIYVMVAKPFL